MRLLQQTVFYQNNHLYPSATAIPQTDFAPDFFKTFAHSAIVAPLV